MQPKNTIRFFITLIFAGMVYGGCGQGNLRLKPDKEALVTGLWAVDTIRFGNEVRTGAQLNQPRMQYYPDHTFEQILEGVSITGKWQINQDTLITRADNEAEDVKLVIKKLTSNYMVLVRNDSKAKLRIAMSKIEEKP